METFERWFLDSDRRLTPLWRAIVYFTLTFVALPMILDPLAARLADRIHLSTALAPASIAFGEGEQLLIVLIATGLFAWYEGRRIDSYFLPIGQALGRRTWEGVVAGAVVAGGVAIDMIALGGMQVHDIALGGTALLTFAITWLFAMVLVGLTEELWFRAYFLKTLWNAIGFWPASLIIAAIFAALHYFFKEGENVWDVITLLWFSLLICYSVRQTGTLWFAVGLHFAFDYTQFFVIGSPNGTLIPQGRLLDVTFNGPAWLTGGVLGTEASFLMYPLLALVTLYVWWRDPTPAPKQSQI